VRTTPAREISPIKFEDLPGESGPGKKKRKK
jgi:hypothetical protein